MKSAAIVTYAHIGCAVLSGTGDNSSRGQTSHAGLTSSLRIATPALISRWKEMGEKIMKPEHLTRRDLLFKSAALGSLTVIPSLSLNEAIWAWQQGEENTRRPTAWDEIGPFYKRDAPHTSQLRRRGDLGLSLRVSGRAFHTRGNTLSGARIEVWQDDHLGHYDLDGYSYRATLAADGEGKYDFDSIMPGHYPGRVCQHIHSVVSAPGHEPLPTQLYFATDPVFEGDPEHNCARDPLIQSSELVRPVTLAGYPGEIHALVNFEVVLERV